MASTEEGPEPLKYQTLTLKVSIHCEGCKKKVKKVLHGIEGVYKITVDSQQQKVIVIGNVEAETLIKKLLKTGKHAELWPEKKPNNPGNSGGGGGKKNKNKNKASDKPNEPSENPESNQTPSGDDSAPDFSANPDGNAPNNGGKDSPTVHNKEAGNSPPPKKQDGGGAAPAASGGGAPAGGGGPAPAGGGGKKKGKKGQKDNSGGGGGSGGGGVGAGGEVQVVSEGTGSKPGSGGGSVASLPAYSYAVYPTSQYVVSYSTVHPSASHGGAFYPMPMNQSSYFYPGATVTAAPPGSCYIFSDENANACRIM